MDDDVIRDMYKDSEKENNKLKKALKEIEAIVYEPYPDWDNENVRLDIDYIFKKYKIRYL